MPCNIALFAHGLISAIYFWGIILLLDQPNSLNAKEKGNAYFVPNVTSALENK